MPYKFDKTDVISNKLVVLISVQ